MVTSNLETGKQSVLDQITATLSSQTNGSTATPDKRRRRRPAPPAAMIRQLLPEDRLDAVYWHESPPYLERVRILFIALLDDDNIEPVCADRRGFDSIARDSNFAGTIPRDADPLDHLNNLSLPSAVRSALSAAKGMGR